MGIGLDDIITSAPSVTGFGLTSAACFAIPAAIPLAGMQFSMISDPAQIWHAGSRHGDLAKKADFTKNEVKEAVNKRAQESQWSGDDKQAFLQGNAQYYLAALEETRDSHNGTNDTLGTLARGYTAAGLLSLTIGGIMAYHAAVVAGLSWVPGVNLAAEGEATAAATASNGVFRTALKGLITFITKAAKLLKGIKGLLALGALGYAGTNISKSMLGLHKAPTAWPGIDPRTGKEAQR